MARDKQDKRRTGPRRYGMAATGGTFDIIHKGHRALLDAAFDLSDMVIIGLTSDEMIASRAAKRTLHAYDERLANLKKFLHARSRPESSYVISRLDDDFGPAVLTPEVRALITSQETACKGDALNHMRRSRGLGPVDIVEIPMVPAYDGRRISTSRIRGMEIDADGNPT